MTGARRELRRPLNSASPSWRASANNAAWLQSRLRERNQRTKTHSPPVFPLKCNIITFTPVKGLGPDNLLTLQAFGRRPLRRKSRLASKP